jgi:hypothetical protein
VFKVVGMTRLWDAAKMSGRDGGIGNVWRDHPEEMAAKTAIIAVSKSIPGIDGNRDLSILAEIEAQHAIGKDVEMPPMESLPTIQQSNIALDALTAGQGRQPDDGIVYAGDDARSDPYTEDPDEVQHPATVAIDEYENSRGE